MAELLKKLLLFSLIVTVCSFFIFVLTAQDSIMGKDVSFSARSQERITLSTKDLSWPTTDPSSQLSLQGEVWSSEYFELTHDKEFKTAQFSTDPKICGNRDHCFHLALTDFSPGEWLMSIPGDFFNGDTVMTMHSNVNISVDRRNIANFLTMWLGGIFGVISVLIIGLALLG